MGAICGGIFVTVLGLVMLIRPELCYKISESWKTEGGGEPSSWYLFNTRLGGGIFTLVGLTCTVLLIVLS